MSEPVDPVNILVVDDRPENLTAMKSVLEQPGYRLITASSASDALRWVLREPFAVMLLDVFMPLMDGIELATMIKSRDKTRDLPIIFLTASEMEVGRILKAYSLGAVDYLVRPIHPQVVRAKVAVFAELYRKTEQIKDHAKQLREHDRREHESEQAELLRRAEEARDRAQSMQRRMTILAEVSRLLSESFDLEISLGKVARHLVDAMSPGCVIELNDPDGRPAPVAVAHEDPAEEARIREGFTRRRSEPDALFTSILAAESTAGTMTLLGTRSKAGWDPDERELASDVGRRIGLFVERASLYERARTAVAARDEFLSIAAHELRTPLTAMMLQIQALGRGLRRKGRAELSEEAMLAKIDGAERQLGRLAYLIEALLDVSRIASKQLTLELAKTDLAKIVQEVAARFTEPAAREGIPIVVRADGPIEGLWDPARVDQIATNLVANAVKYGQSKPVEISARADGEVAELVVRDHGLGIAPENLDRIFQRFERAALPVGYGGLGLGLYIAKELVAAHGGTIAAQSRPGHGTELTVRLPLAARSQAELLDDAEEHADLDGFPQNA